MSNKFYLMIIFFLVLSLAGCSSMDVAVSNKFYSQKKIEKIVVFPFQLDGTKCGPEFSDAISHQFVKSGKFDVVEREALNKLIEEDKLSMSGLIDETKATAIGKKLGVDAIILGRGTAEQIKVYNCIKSFSLRVISVETATQIITARVAEGKNLRYDDLAEEIVPEILKAIDKIEKKREVKEKPIEVSNKQKEAASEPVTVPVKAETSAPEKPKTE